ncbi:MAG: hypothetical protein M3Q87_09860 [Actinomycetota bacterium]|nr:hypothetical protein [Actinomycetota bacterium]
MTGLSQAVTSGHDGRVQQAVWESERKRVRRSQWWVPVLIGVALALAQVTLVARAWRDCGIDGATGLTSFSLYALGVPALTFLNAVLVALPTEVYMSRRGPRTQRLFLTVAAVAVLVGAETLVLGHFVATPTEPIGSQCEGNVPQWWPQQLPT